MNFVRQRRAELAQEATIGMINSRYEAQKERMKRVFDQAIRQLEGEPIADRFAQVEPDVPKLHLHSGSTFVPTADVPMDEFEAPKMDFLLSFSEEEEEERECTAVGARPSIDSLYVETGSVNSKREDPEEASSEDDGQQPKYVIERKCFDSASDIELPEM